MDHYQLTVYHSTPCYNSSPQQHLTWIELQDTINHRSHIFSFIPGDHNGMMTGCGFLRKKSCIPEDVQPAAHISLTEMVYTEMLQEGNHLHNHFLLFDDGNELPQSHYN